MPKNGVKSSLSKMHRRRGMKRMYAFADVYLYDGGLTRETCPKPSPDKQGTCTCSCH
jgi:hypothetical protein